MEAGSKQITDYTMLLPVLGVDLTEQYGAKLLDLVIGDNRFQ